MRPFVRLAFLAMSTVVVLSAAPSSADLPILVATWGGSGSEPGEFQQPYGVATEGTSFVYVADQANNRVQKFTPSGGFVMAWGEQGSGPGQLLHPSGIHLANGQVYVVEHQNHRVSRFATDGAFLGSLGSPGQTLGQLSHPVGITSDAAGNLYIAEATTHRVQKFSSTGTPLLVWGGYGSAPGQMISPYGVEVGPDGLVYVSEYNGSRVQVFTADGVYVRGWGGYGTAPGQFRAAEGMVFDENGDVYVCDTGNDRVQKFTATGDWLGAFPVPFESEGRPIPSDIARDGAGNLYVVAYGTSQVHKYAFPCPSVEVSLDFDPNTLNLQSMGHWVTGTLEPEPPASPSDIDIASILLNGSVPVDASAPTSIGDADADGRPDLTVKFDRAAVELAVAEGDAVPVTVTGEIGDGCFSATDVIRVIRGHVTAPAAGSVLEGGGTAEVRWDTPAGVHAQSVAVLWSGDDGASWSLVANGEPNSGSYNWSLPSSATSAARVAVVLVESADPSGYEVTGVLGVSGRFAITMPLGVIGSGLELALFGSTPNPSRSLTVSFSLPDAEPATLVAYDVSGREVARSAVDAMGAGRHVVTLDTSRTLAPGIYLVNLVRGDRRLAARTVIVP